MKKFGMKLIVTFSNKKGNEKIKTSIMNPIAAFLSIVPNRKTLITNIIILTLQKGITILSIPNIISAMIFEVIGYAFTKSIVSPPYLYIVLYKYNTYKEKNK
ncbi:DUF4408 domain-containing protein [Thermosipho melanesiensis]|uniref:DUF4408 domain-containing protein n=1 Tax=Thermosipho melanesiensis TaxID=46541 RepID=UPI0011D03FF7|nr:DUF4408 domain-containing protein [Thermosipho melanesiensis]